MTSRWFRTPILWAAIFASVFLLAAMISTVVVKNGEADQSAVFAGSQNESKYLLRSFNGHVAVYFSETDETPGIETSIEVKNLRAVDQEKLSEGIKAKTYEEVLNLLEDFNS